VGADGQGDLPLDPDVEASTFDLAPRPRWPRIDLRLVAAVAVGGFVGGLVRYAVGEAWPTPSGSFPWATFTVNTVGAFVLALLVVLVLEVLPPTRYVRALVGTGFCGALTTFSSVATGVDQLVAHGHAAVAIAYVVASLAAGLAAGLLGLGLGRALARARRR
jgi:CrcB protein